MPKQLPMQPQLKKQESQLRQQRRKQLMINLQKKQPKLRKPNNNSMRKKKPKYRKVEQLLIKL